MPLCGKIHALVNIPTHNRVAMPPIKGYNVFKLGRWLTSVGIPPILSGVDGGSHMLLLKNEMPEVWNKTYKVLEPSDYLSLKFTGKFQTNENTGFGYTLIKKAGWSKGVLMRH